MSKLITRTDVVTPVSMPPAVSAWFEEQHKRFTHNRAPMPVMDALELRGGRVFPGKQAVSHSSRLNALLDSITNLDTKFDSLGTKFSSLGTKFDSFAAVAKPAPAAVRPDSTQLTAANARLAALQKEITEMKTRLPAEIPADQRGLFTAAQASWEKIAEAFGDAQVRRPLAGESLADYNRALMTPYKVHSKAWKDLDAYQIPDGVIDIAVNQIRADALEAAKSPVTAPGEMKMRECKDDSGRLIRKFYGDISAMLDLSRNPRRYVTGFPALAAR